MKKYILAIIILIRTATAVAQDDKIEADRPTEAQATAVVSKKTFQAELGIRKEQDNSQDFSWQHPEILLRYGLLKRLELRLRTSIESERLHSKHEFNDGLTPVELGIKAAFFQTKDSTFSTSLYGHIGIPQLASKDHKHHTTFYRVRLLFENKLTQKIKLNTNIGRDWDSRQKTQNWMYAVAPQIQIGEKWEASLETYGFFRNKSKPEHFVDAGIAYFASNNVKLDLNAGKGLHEPASYFFTTGVSFRL